jgi:hypothetical protein
MEITSLAIEIVAGALAGNAISAAMKQSSLSIISRTIIGAVGGLLGGLAFILTGAESTISGALVDIYSGAFGGAILTPVAGALIGATLKARH